MGNRPAQRDTIDNGAGRDRGRSGAAGRRCASTRCWRRGRTRRSRSFRSRSTFLKSAKIIGTYALGVRLPGDAVPAANAGREGGREAGCEALMGMMKTKEPATGFYDYDGSAGQTTYSLSRSQYAVLGVWAAAQMGVEIPTATGDGRKAWIERQEADGGWRLPEGQARHARRASRRSASRRCSSRRSTSPPTAGSRCRGNLGIQRDRAGAEVHGGERSTSSPPTRSTRATSRTPRSTPSSGSASPAGGSISARSTGSRRAPTGC